MLVFSSPASDTTYDVPQFLHDVSSVAVTESRSGTQRVEYAEEVAILDPTPAKVTCPPLIPDVFCDGIQACSTVRHYDGRPVQLAYVAAGAVTPQGELVGLVEDMTALASTLDKDVLDVASTHSQLPAYLVDSDSPPTLEHHFSDYVRSLRENAERSLVTQLLVTCPVVAVDGALAGMASSPALVGVVKTTATKYLPDESQLWSLKPGYRSAIFEIPSAAGTDKRYSTYVRLHPPVGGWDFGLIRVEAFALDVLEPAASAALAYRQDGTYKDSRWDRHLRPVRVCEDVLRERRPKVFR